MSRLPYKWRMILPVMLSLLIGITVLFSVVGISFSNAMYSNSKAESQDIALRYASQVKIGMSSVLSAVRGMGEMLSEEVAAKTATRAGWVDAIKVILRDNPYMQGIYLYFEPNAFDGLDDQYRNLEYHDATGVFSPYVSMNGGVVNISSISLAEHQKNGYYQAVQQTGSEYFSNPIEKNGKLIATAVIPVQVNNHFIGFVAAEMNFTYVENLLIIEKLDMFPNAFIQVIAPDGIYVAHTRSEYVGKNTFDIGAKEATQTFREVLSSKQMITADVFSAVAGETCSYITAPISILDNAQPWLVSVVIPRSDSNAPVIRTILSALLVVGVVIFATLIMLFITSNVSVKRLTAMNDHLYNTTRSGIAASTQISDTGEILAQGGVEQAASIEETSAMANQTATMLKENTESTAQVALLANEAVEAASDGLVRVEDLITSMQELEISSEEIAKIIAIIDSIAFQTSILALNASVEAARVGDAGKGFTVVAEEVRNLATRSTEAAGNTSVIVGRNLQLSRQGVVSSSEVSQALREISAKNNEVNDLVAQISAASQEQLTGINHIHIALAQMEDVTQSNAAVAEENSAAASELKEQAYKLSVIQEILSAVVLGTKKARSEKQAATY